MRIAHSEGSLIVKLNCSVELYSYRYDHTFNKFIAMKKPFLAITDPYANI